MSPLSPPLEIFSTLFLSLNREYHCTLSYQSNKLFTSSILAISAFAIILIHYITKDSKKSFRRRRSPGIVLFHDTRSNDSRSIDAQFMHKLSKQA